MISGSLLAGLLLSGCTGTDHGSAPHPSTHSSGATGAEPAVDATGACTRPNFTPSTHITVTHEEPAVVYARAYTLPPGGSVHTDTPAPAQRLDYVPIGTHGASGAVRLADADRDQILGSGGGEVSHGRIPERTLVPVRLANHTHESRSYLVYRGALAESGTWSLRVCGAPYTDGSRAISVRGTFHSIGPLGQVRTAACGVAHPHADVIQRHAARRACA